MNHDLLVRKKILQMIENSDYIKGRNYNPSSIKSSGKIEINNETQYRFSVLSERFDNTKYHVWITYNDKGNLIRVSCDCLQFDRTNSCKHVGACLWHYKEELFQMEPLAYQEQFTQTVFDCLKRETNKRAGISQKIHFELYVSTDGYPSYYQDMVELYFKIGLDKLYMCRGYKVRNVLEAICQERELVLGKNFTLDMHEQFLSKDEEEIIDFLYEIEPSSYVSIDFTLSRGSVKQFFHLLEGKTFYLNNILITEHKRELPMQPFLQKREETYILTMKDIGKIKKVTKDLEYVQVENTLYHVPKNGRILLRMFLKDKKEELRFSMGQLEEFKKYVLPFMKDKIVIEEGISEIVITGKPSVKLYFDLYQDFITCNLKFTYGEVTIDYFDTQNTSVIRDATYEKEIVQQISPYGFVLEKEKFVLTDVDSMVYFLEDGLKDLSAIYEIYTTEKLKSVDVVKKTSISSTFSIGKDNIMSYSFDLGAISSKEIASIFDAMEQKKRYYKLKSGDILALEENQNLKAFRDLTEEMELEEKDLKEGEGSISKYKAIYLDSLKAGKNFKIKTNNLFKQLIDDFHSYKDSQISFTAKEKKVLRPYQMEGVRWLYTLTKTGFGGILADEMGLGKSIQTIYYIKELLKENPKYQFLIVVPTSLVYNWENEFLKFAPDLKYKMVVGPKNKRKEENLEEASVLITTYGLLREDEEMYKDILFKTMIIDEAQNIKNINTEVTKTVKRIQADTKLALTGTPIENSISELWSIFDYIMPGYLGSSSCFEKKYKITDFEKDDEKIKRLNKLIHPFILRRYKKDVMKDLPDKIENNIYVELTDMQKKIYVEELNRVNEELDLILKKEGISKARFLILKLLTKLRQICIDPSLLYENYKGGSGKMDEFVNVVKTSVQNGHKILVFTSFRAALFEAQKRLTKEKITSYEIDGSTSSKMRMELVEKFNQDTTNVFFIMLKAGGTGLNLTGADVVIHLDLWWNPQAENQATDRAHRIGQKNVVEVIKLISKGTIEEKILELQNKKKILTEKLIDENQEQNAFTKLTEKDIRELLKMGSKE